MSLLDDLREEQDREDVLERPHPSGWDVDRRRARRDEMEAREHAAPFRPHVLEVTPIRKAA